jgi:hypothetical protein
VKLKLIVGGVVLLAVFLVGFVPQYLKVWGLRQELETAKQQLAADALTSRLCALRDQAAMLYVETARNNYGLAGELAGRFFQDLGQFASTSAPPDMKPGLEEILSSRDAITAGLAKADPATRSAIEALLVKIHAVTKR